MNKIILTLVLGALFMSCGVKKKLQGEPEYVIGWYLECEENGASKIVKDAFLDRVYHIESNPVLTVSDFQTVNIEKPIWAGKEHIIIGIKLNDDVWEKWADLTERMSRTGEKVLFIYENKVFSNLSASLRINNGNAMIIHERLNEEKLNEIINTIEREKESEAE